MFAEYGLNEGTGLLRRLKSSGLKDGEGVGLPWTPIDW